MDGQHMYHASIKKRHKEGVCGLSIEGREWADMHTALCMSLCIARDPFYQEFWNNIATNTSQVECKPCNFASNTFHLLQTGTVPTFESIVHVESYTELIKKRKNICLISVYIPVHHFINTRALFNAASALSHIKQNPCLTSTSVPVMSLLLFVIQQSHSDQCTFN